MDKYAVDLDQLLNDFEYSELTDSYPPVQRNLESTSYNQNNIVKHSINNVFHSLNEYLNTDITPKPNTNDTQAFQPDLLHTSTSNCNINLSVDNNLNNTDKVLLQSEENNVKGEHAKIDISSETTNIIEENGFQINKELVKDTTGNTNETNQDLLDQSKPSSEDTIKVLIEESKELIEENLSNIEYALNNEDKKEIQIENVEKFDSELEEKDLICNETEDAELSINEEIKTEETTTYEDDNNTQVKDTNLVTAIAIQEPDTNVDLNLCNQVNDSNINVSKDIQIEEKIIGFDETFDLNDSELNELLEKLEDEFQKEESKENVNNLECEVTPVDNVNNENSGEHMNNINVDINDSEDKTNLLISDNVDSNIDNKMDMVASNEITSESNCKIDHVDIDKKEVLQSFSSEDDNIQIENVLVEEDSAVTKQQEEVHLRPDNLPLNNQSTLDIKKINLIGEPGSTPYNNVYKDMPKAKNLKTQDSDSEYSTSASPTFSDTSTSDTASTCSADNVPPIDQKQYKKDPRNKSNIASMNRSTGNQTTLDKNDESVEKKTEDGVPAQGEMAPVENVVVEDPDDSREEGDENASNIMNEEAEGAVGGTEDKKEEDEGAVGTTLAYGSLGKKAPYWMPDHEADKCLHCEAKFTVIKRRHHCRACGKVLCSKCCNMKYKLAYLDADARVCYKCHESLIKMEDSSSSSSDVSVMYPPSPMHRPNPNNPAEYCSTVSPLEQVGASSAAPPAVMVPVGVLKRKGSNKAKTNKTVMFCDGIRPGSDLTNLDNDFNYNNTKTGSKKPDKKIAFKVKTNVPQLDPTTKSFIPNEDGNLPPTVTIYKCDVTYTDCQNTETLVETLKNDQLIFALNLNLYVYVKIVNMDCCVNKVVWCFSTEGLINVGQDEVVILLEIIEGESLIPKDMFYHINCIYLEAVKGSSVKELGLSLHSSPNFLDSKNHAGFVFIKPSFQCLQNVIVPKEPYLIGILIHRWETPWAKLFPLRLILRLGALYRYYPSPIISTRHRDSVFVEIGHTIINLLADFRNYSYTLPQIRGLTIHMEDKNTTITIPGNRYDQVMKSVNNSTDHILAFAGNFSQEADSHLVCIQDTQNNENCYSTHAINIHNKPRKVTGASFIVFNGALKSSSGLTAKSNIVEDGLMIQVLPEHMVEIRDSLRSMKNYTIPCGCVNATTDENVHIVWGENDVNFNAGVTSPIDNTTMAGIPSIRVHNGKDYVCNSGNRLIRWTEVFIIQNNEDSPKNHDPIDISKVSESIAKATCSALVKYLDLLVTNNFFKIAIRTTLHVENVSYSAGGNNMKLPPIYMKSLDNELIPVLHRITSNNLGEHAVVLELVFRILNT